MAVDDRIPLFQEAFTRVDASIGFCARNAYIHVHGPGQRILPQGCRSHFIIIERNGTVGLAQPLAGLLGADQRPNLSITRHPLGYSSGPSYGRFAYGLTYERIILEYGGLDYFASELIQKALFAGIW